MTTLPAGRLELRVDELGMGDFAKLQTSLEGYPSPDQVIELAQSGCIDAQINLVWAAARQADKAVTRDQIADLRPAEFASAVERLDVIGEDTADPTSGNDGD